MNRTGKIKTIIRNYGVSVLVHLILFLVIALLVEISPDNENMRSPYLQVTTGMFTKEKTAFDEIPEAEREAKQELDAEEVPEESVSYFYSPDDKNIDTTGLPNLYSEKTLNVRIKYPGGWTFIDQNVRKKLDGVTFWGLTDIYDPPPYIHLEVRQKYLFNPSRYQHSEELDNYSIHYNDPEETSGQYKQEIYIRTREDVDYSLKLIMRGREQFKTFQPVFFGMLKTFKFG